MDLFTKIRELAAQTQAVYLSVLLAAKASMEAKRAAREAFLAMGARGNYMFSHWDGPSPSKVYSECRSALVDRINALMSGDTASFFFRSDELPDLELPSFRDSEMQDLDAFYLVEIDAALKADFTVSVESVIAQFSPEAIAKRAREEAVSSVRSVLELDSRWTVVRESGQGMVFELSFRNDPAPRAAICYDTARRICAIARAIGSLIATEDDPLGVGRIDVYAVADAANALRESKPAGRIRVDASSDLRIAVFKSKMEVHVSTALFTLISAATATESEAA
jgi:hypothetical protein